MTGRWLPTGTNSHPGPPAVGALIAHDHAVWTVAAVTTLELTEEDRQRWMAAGMPDLDTWRDRPYRLSVQFVAGARPAWAPEGKAVPPGRVNVPGSEFNGRWWDTYPASGRWPMCSCCGEPMPCRAEIQDREVAAGLKHVEKFAKKTPESCWGCDDPITRRQKWVTYPGENLDLPGAPAPRFHTRDKCGHWARQYELRWIVVDPRRERILTYPKCPGILVVHGDGTTECRSGRSPLGQEVAGVPDCRGHLTHDHGTQVSCFVGESYFSPVDDFPGCPRGCAREGHGGTGRQSRRPARRSSSLMPTTDA